MLFGHFYTFWRKRKCYRAVGLAGMNLEKKSKSAVPDGKALSFASTQLGHHVSLLIGLANEGVRFVCLLASCFQS